MCFRKDADDALDDQRMTPRLSTLICQRLFEVDGNIWNAPCENEPTPGSPICLVIVYFSLAEIDDIDVVEEWAAGRAPGILAWGRLPSRWRVAADGRGGLGSQNDLVDQVPMYLCIHVSQRNSQILPMENSSISFKCKKTFSFRI
jgi:hypothetical protein